MKLKRYNRAVRREYYLIAGLVAALQLTACGGGQLGATETLAPSPIPSTVIPADTATPSPQPETPVSAICTPLAEHEISEMLLLYLTQAFSPPLGANKETGHHGLDFAYYHGGPNDDHIQGTPIQSVLDAVVVGMGYNAVYGYYLITETPFSHLPTELAELYEATLDESLYLLYAHMQQPAPFALEAELACGQVVGRVGDSGDRYFLTDPHLHFETRVGAHGLRPGPMAYYAPNATAEERANYELWRTSDTFRLSDPTLLLSYAGQP